MCDLIRSEPMGKRPWQALQYDGIVTADARLRVGRGLYRVDVYKVAAMALWLIVPSKVPLGKVGTVAAALMAIKAPRLLVTLLQLLPGFAGQDTMSSHKVGIMVGRNALSLVAIIALLDGHGGVILMRHLLCISLLLEIHQDASQKRKHENNLFH